MTDAGDIPEGYKATELGVLPEEWGVITLEEVAKINYGKAKPQDTGEIPVFGSGGIYGYVSKSLINQPTVIIGRKGTAGKVWLVEKPSWPSDTTFYLEWKKNPPDCYFIFNYLNFAPLFASLSKTTLPSLQKPDLVKKKIPLPPLPEQHAIATTLRTVQEAKEKTEAVIAATKALKAAMMKHLFTYGPVPPEEAEKVALKETEIGQVPEGWEISTLGKIAHVGNGSTPKRDNPAYWENGTNPWITSTRVHDSIITQADFFVTELAIRECHLPLVKKGSLVVAITGQGKTLGNTALVSFDTRINQHLAYVEFNDDSVVSEFMLKFMQSRYQQLRDVSHSAGSTKGALTCGFLKTYPVPLPSKNVQMQISQILSALDQKLAAEQSRKQALDTLFATLLHDLMTAKIRVIDAGLTPASTANK